MRKKLFVFMMMLLSCLTLCAFGLVACTNNSSVYDLQINNDNVLIYQSEFNFEEYFEDSYILKTLPDGEEFYIPLTIDMLSSQIDTSRR